jgi:hypothetical protein
MKKIKGHDDAMEDKKMFHSMLKKALPKGKVTSHLKKDIGESKKSIHEDKELMQSLKKGKK